MKFNISNPSLTSKGFLKVYTAEVTYDTFTGNEPITATREMMDRGDSVAVVLYEKDTNSLLFTNQFRYPAAEKDKKDNQSDAGWLLELPAGGFKEAEDPADAARREVEEEIGYHIQELEHICTFYVSPGGTSERLHLYYAEVSTGDKKSQGGGLKYEKEDIRLDKLPADVVEEAIKEGTLRDAKTIIGLQWWLLHKKR